MASIQTILKNAPQALLGSQSLLNAISSPSCPNSPISCRNTTDVANLCCFNYPGGQLLQTQFWDTHPATGPSDSWTLHGLWPDHCDGTFDQFCDDTRAYRNITAILESYGEHELLETMSTYWKDYQGHDQNLWYHEWSKHGTCVNTLDPSCYASYTSQEEVVDYFRSAVTVFQLLPSYEWLTEGGVVPSTSETYSEAQIQDILSAKHGQPVTLRCRSGQLDEIWYHFDVQGSVQSGTFIATVPDGPKGNCPANGIKYLPKSSTRPTSTRGSTPGPSQPPRGPFSGKGYLKVEVDGHEKGCIISDGTWYTSGTCATFYATQKDGEVELSSRKGKCAITGHASEFKCQHSIKHATTFGADGSSLLINGQSTFFAEKAPHGFSKSKVSGIQENAGDVQLTITWQSR